MINCYRDMSYTVIRKWGDSFVGVIVILWGLGGFVNNNMFVAISCTLLLLSYRRFGQRVFHEDFKK